jgi:hypothetical protein
MSSFSECKKYNVNYLYCKSCSSNHLRGNFFRWTSGDSNIDELIQNSQLNANYMTELIEWIEYSNLENIELVANGGFGSVYRAIWKDGSIIGDKHFRNSSEFEFRRKSKKVVAVKKFRNMINVNSEFLNEVK